MTTMFLTVICIACVAALLWAEKHNRVALRAIAKTSASAAFVLTAYANGALATPAGATILIGLALCMVGDIFLLSKGQRFFLGGLAAFAAGHIAYIVAFTQLGASIERISTTFTVPGTLAAGAVMHWLWPHLGSMRLPVAFYTAIIALMVAASFSAQPSWILIAGAVGFAISDIAVAKDQFIEDKFANKLWGLPLYYGAQLLFANSV